MAFFGMPEWMRLVVVAALTWVTGCSGSADSSCGGVAARLRSLDAQLHGSDRSAREQSWSGVVNETDKSIEVDGLRARLVAMKCAGASLPSGVIDSCLSTDTVDATIGEALDGRGLCATPWSEPRPECAPSATSPASSETSQSGSSRFAECIAALFIGPRSYG